jgi:hypothetical protein
MTTIVTPLGKAFRWVADDSYPRRALIQHWKESAAIWVKRHRPSLIIGGILLAVVTFVSFYNLDKYPGLVNGDEGIYVSQAWSVFHMFKLSPYEYWYDHPPAGWILIAIYEFVTQGFHRAASAVVVGRELMAICNLVASGLIYLLARRLGFRRIFAVATVLLFALSPLALQYHRMVFLDNIAVVWLLAAFVFAASPRRGLAAAAGAGLCIGMAMLSKETFLLMFPVVLWILIQHTVKEKRIWNLVVFFFLTAAAGGQWLISAALKSELFSGPGHVSLQDAVLWQLTGREGSGAIWEPGSSSYSLVTNWLEADPWLLPAGALLIPFGFLVKQLRPFALGLTILMLIMFTGGYLPYPYAIGLMPFAAIMVAGIGNRLWIQAGEFRHKLGFSRWLVNFAKLVPATAAAIAFLVFATPGWASALTSSVTTDMTGPSREATLWMDQNLPRDATIIVDDYKWPDLKINGFTRGVLYTKADLDPAVKRQMLPEGYKSIDYVALGPLPDDTIRQLPTVAQAIENSVEVARFGNGEFTIRQVKKP